MHGLIFRPVTYKKLLQYTFKNNKAGLRQHLEVFEGFLIKQKMNADTTLTIIMYCRVLIHSGFGLSDRPIWTDFVGGCVIYLIFFAVKKNRGGSPFFFFFLGGGG